MTELFRRFSAAASTALGSPWAFLLTLAYAVWFYYFSGANFSDAVNTNTYILSVLAIVLTELVLANQSRSDKVRELQVDEIIRALPKARNEVINADELDDRQLMAAVAQIKESERG